MNENPREPNARPAFEELEGALRRAVEAARAESVPQEALNRSLGRACGLAVSANGHTRKYTKGLFAVAGLAASLLVGSLLWVGLRGNPMLVANKSGPLDTVAMAPSLAMEELNKRSKAQASAPELEGGFHPPAQALIIDREQLSLEVPMSVARPAAPALPAASPETPGAAGMPGREKMSAPGGPGGVRAETIINQYMARPSGQAGAPGGQSAPPTSRPGDPSPNVIGDYMGPARTVVPGAARGMSGQGQGRPGSNNPTTPMKDSNIANRGGPPPAGPRGESAPAGGMPLMRQQIEDRAGSKALARPARAAPGAGAGGVDRLSERDSREQSDRKADGKPLSESLEKSRALHLNMEATAPEPQKPAIQDSRRKLYDEWRYEREAVPSSNATKGTSRLGALKYGAESDATKKDAKDKGEAAQVWLRDRQRPTFARVYVGNGNSLELVSLQVTVTVEGPRARTVVDHIFHNPHNRQLEGTFEYPLPTGASASYFAMFPGLTRDTAPARFRGRETRAIPADALARLTPAEIVKQVSTEDWGNLQEARVVSKAKALETYEDIVRGQIDPALLEYSGGNTFSGRVFPIAPLGYNRVLIAYEELLPYTQRGVQYRFPLPDCKLTELQFALSADQAEGKEAHFVPEGESKLEAGRKSFTRRWTDKGPGGDAVFTYTPAQPQLQAISGRQGESGPLYFYARVRPDLPVEAAKPFAEHAVFLLDTSLSEHPDRFTVNMQLLRRILEADEAIKRFNILAFDVAARWVDPQGWMDNTREGRDKALDRLDGVVLEGATDVSAALTKLTEKGAKSFSVAEATPVNVFLLSDGQITWGEAEVAALVARFESRCRFPVHFHCYRTGLGADNLELFEALTRRGGGVFNCYASTDIPAAALAHRHECFEIDRVNLVAESETTDLLVAGRRAAVYPGGELIVAARAEQPGSVQLVLEGNFLGKHVTRRYPFEVKASGELAPRGWAEIAVASLLALNDPKLDDLVTAYCQQFGIASRVASFLVLENANDYKRLNLEAERGKTVPGGDLGRFLNDMWSKLGSAVGNKVAFDRFLDKIAPRVPLKDGPNGAHVRKLLALVGDEELGLPEESAASGLPKAEQLPAAYLAARQRDRRDVAAYLTEARRRVDAKDAGGAVRVLSSVIEEYPARADALRLVGYRLLALNQAGQAARLFRQVQDQRPFEPHSYRDLARSLEETGKFGWAALEYEIVLAGSWHNRFRESLKAVAQEEYVRMMRQAIQKQAVSGKLADEFGERLEQLASVRTQNDLRVTMSWNTDATDVDLWVIEPDGTKCFYQHNRTKNGGELSQDQTQGYGPERYQLAHAQPGVYTVIVHYFRPNANLLAGETHVNVVVTKNADTPREESRRYNVILKKHDEQVEVCKVRVGEK